MLVKPECYPCLSRLARQASDFASSDPLKSEAAYQAALSQLDILYQPSEISIVIATAIHQTIRDSTGNPDPYSPMKRREIEMARLLHPARHAGKALDLAEAVRLAALGNSIDFFRSSVEMNQDLRSESQFAVDDTPKLAALLAERRNILYLADNAGEAFFDLPLFNYLKDYGKVTYVVKGSAVQNDITLADLADTGLAAEFGQVLTTGTATPGIDMRTASKQFRDAIKSTNLIVSKGMGYFESLPEYGLTVPVFYCLKAKCGPVARTLSVPIGSYVAKLM